MHRTGTSCTVGPGQNATAIIMMTPDEVRRLGCVYIMRNRGCTVSFTSLPDFP